MVEAANSNVKRFNASTSMISVARNYVADGVTAVRPGWSRLGDLVLVVSELVTNAVEYSREPFEVALDAGHDDVVVSVASSMTDDVHTDVAMWVGPVVGGRQGRGLMLVRALADDVTVDADGERLTIRCRFALDGPGGEPIG